MKYIHRSLLISLVPLLSLLTAFAQSGKQVELESPNHGTKGGAASLSASQVMGLSVKNAADETIGEIEDLVLDMKSGKVLAVVVRSGGFLDIAHTLSSVPVSALRYDGAAKAFKTRLTKDQLGKAPQFMTDAWLCYYEAASAEALRACRCSVGGEVTAPDNTRQNEKEMTGHAATPTDQDNSAKDMQGGKWCKIHHPSRNVH